MGLTMKPKDLIKFLESNGYEFIRARGSSHHIYSDGTHTVSIPIHGGSEFNEKFIKRLLRQTNINLEVLLKYLNR